MFSNGLAWRSDYFTRADSWFEIGTIDAIDGLNNIRPTLGLSGLPQYDTSVLSSVNMQFDVTGDGRAQSGVRAPNATGPSQVISRSSTMLHATLDQSSNQSVRQSEYVRGVLLSDVTTPTNMSNLKDLLALLNLCLTITRPHGTAVHGNRRFRGIHGTVLLKGERKLK
ncbi:hypothetical protein [Paraburkholderia sp. BL18I3N2]|uniref:hypothetical protein n=1 Tax=Paraburkholderia sp. BL18I3N2 TaxID=1938799 RepID=UPI000D072548|nr:hypothetical protein [Paraburkholderia sp. BL18I3N2]